MKTAIGWAHTTRGKVNGIILEQLRALNPRLAAGPVLFQASLYSTHLLLTREGGEFSSQHLSRQDQLEAERVQKGRETFRQSSLAWLMAIIQFVPSAQKALQRAVSHQHPSLSL